MFSWLAGPCSTTDLNIRERSCLSHTLNKTQVNIISSPMTVFLTQPASHLGFWGHSGCMFTSPPSSSKGMHLRERGWGLLRLRGGSLLEGQSSAGSVQAGQKGFYRWGLTQHRQVVC